MKCPACGSELTQMVAGDVVVDVCQTGCGGIWFDAFELRRVDQSESASAALEAIGERADFKTEHPVKRRCPRCEDQIMMRRPFSRNSSVQIDECPACGGQWLDGGELARIHAETRRAREEQHPANARLPRTLHQYFAQPPKSPP